MKPVIILKDWFKVAVLCIAAFVGIAVTLGWHDFRDGMENFLVLTSAETVRDGHWLVPTLDGEARFQKPPLPHWVGAAGLQATRLGFSTEFSARWTTLLLAVGAIPAVYLAGSLLISKRGGVTCAAAFASSFFFLKYTHRAGYDMQMTCWTAWTTAMLVWGVTRARLLQGFSLAGLFLGLALETKGPPALLPTVVPFALWLYLCRRDYPLRGLRRAAIVGAVVAAVVGLCWYGYLLTTQQGLMDKWYGQVTLQKEKAQEDLTRLNSSNNLLLLLAMTGPWTLWYLAGFVGVARERLRVPPALLLGTLIVVLHAGISIIVAPLRERYLLPALFGGALMVGATVEWLRRERFREAGTLAAAQWVVLAGMCGFAVFFAARVSLGHDLPAGHPLVAVLVGAAGAGIAVLALVRCRENLSAVVGWTPVVMLLWGASYYLADSFTEGEISPTKPVARELAARYPDARLVYVGTVNMLPREFTLYMDRTIHLDPEGNALAHPVPGTVVFQEHLRDRATPPGAEALPQFRFKKVRWDLYYFPPASR